LFEICPIEEVADKATNVAFVNEVHNGLVWVSPSSGGIRRGSSSSNTAGPLRRSSRGAISGSIWAKSAMNFLTESFELLIGSDPSILRSATKQSRPGTYACSRRRIRKLHV
jgi:hypothetical protein